MIQFLYKTLHINDKTILHIILNHEFIGIVNLIDVIKPPLIITILRVRLSFLPVDILHKRSTIVLCLSRSYLINLKLFHSESIPLGPL